MHTIFSQDTLLECRQNFGKEGTRKFGILDRLCYLNIKKPAWCSQKDKLWQLFKHKWDVLNHGHIVWGHIVQANVLLFKAGVHNCPASVIFSSDPTNVVGLRALSHAAQCMFDLKNTTPEDEELLDIANALTDEMTRTFGVRVPQQFSNGFTLYESSTFISRKHLPNRILSKAAFPLLVTAEKPYYCFPLPSKYWPRNLIHYWCNNEEY